MPNLQDLDPFHDWTEYNLRLALTAPIVSQYGQMNVGVIDISPDDMHNRAVPDVNLEFGRRLREARIANRLSQDYVARTVGLSRTSITNIEAGRQHIALGQLYALATAVRRDPSDLLPEPPRQVVPIPGLESELTRRKISPDFASVVNSIMEKATSGPTPR